MTVPHQIPNMSHLPFGMDTGAARDPFDFPLRFHSRSLKDRSGDRGRFPDRARANIRNGRGLTLLVPRDATIVGDDWEPMSEPTVSLRNPAKAAFLAWLVPGLGHFYQGRTGKGTLYAVCILGLYLMGMVMGEGKIVYWRWVNPLNNPEKFCLYYLGQFFVGLPALPALIQSTLQHYGWDPIFWGFMAEPSQEVLNGLQTRLGSSSRSARSTRRWRAC